MPNNNNKIIKITYLIHTWFYVILYDFRKIKDIYQIIQPVAFVQLGAQSMLIILQAYMIFIVNMCLSLKDIIIPHFNSVLYWLF